MRLTRIFLALLLASIFAISACSPRSETGGIVRDSSGLLHSIQEHDTILRVALAVGIDKILDRHPEWADDLEAGIDVARGILRGETPDIATVIGQVIGMLPTENLNDNEKLLATLVAAELTAAVQRYANQRGLESVEQIRGVLNMVLDYLDTALALRAAVR